MSKKGVAVMVNRVWVGCFLALTACEGAAFSGTLDDPAPSEAVDGGGANSSSSSSSGTSSGADAASTDPDGGGAVDSGQDSGNLGTPDGGADSGSPSELTADPPVYAALFPLVESYVRNQTYGLGLSPTSSIKVAVVTDSEGSALASATTPLLTWNGGLSTAVSTDPDYLPITLSNIPAAEMQLLTFQPQIVISFAGAGFPQLMAQLEVDWTANPKPYYVLSPYNEGSASILSLFGSDATLLSRLSGVSQGSVYCLNSASYVTDVLSLNAGTLTGNFSCYDFGPIPQ
jgi:hypothetical protein